MVSIQICLHLMFNCVQKQNHPIHITSISNVIP